MTTLHEAAQQALEALTSNNDLLGTMYLKMDAVKALKAALEQPEQPQEATHLRELLKRIRQWDALDIPDSDGAHWKREIDAALEQPEQEPAAFDALVAISLLTHLGGEVADYEDVVEAVRRLHSVNTELGAALRRLISYCNTLENRLMEADGEHPAMQEAKEAYAKAEGKV